jgi:hypothetical protein
VCAGYLRGFAGWNTRSSNVERQIGVFGVEERFASWGAILTEVVAIVGSIRLVTILVRVQRRVMCLVGRACLLYVSSMMPLRSNILTTSSMISSTP